MNRSLLLVALVVTVGLAGCVGTDGPTDNVTRPSPDEPDTGPAAVNETLSPDGGCGEDAGDSFEDATKLCGDPVRECTPGSDDPYLCHDGVFNGSDTVDHYRIPLQEGDPLVADVYADTDLDVQLLDPNGAVVADSTGSETVQLATSAQRVEVERAHVGGDYRLKVGQGPVTSTSGYGVCLRPCEEPTGVVDQSITFQGIYHPEDTQILLVPPTHGDLGNADGPTTREYVNETLRGIHEWAWALDRFAEDHPEYGYLANISIEVDVFDGTNGTPVQPAGYDVVIGYVASGPAFRGVAACCFGLQETIEGADLEDHVRYEGRYIALSLFAAAPRAGQALEDFPERTDLHEVTMHEFAHTFGLGHTWTWTEAHGPDLMNSPAPFVYGDGDPAGDGGERTERECISSLNLYGMAVLYDGMKTNQPPGDPSSSVTLPADIPYELYCPEDPIDAGVVDDVPEIPP